MFREMFERKAHVSSLTERNKLRNVKDTKWFSVVCVQMRRFTVKFHFEKFAQSSKINFVKTDQEPIDKTWQDGYSWGIRIAFQPILYDCLSIIIITQNNEQSKTKCDIERQLMLITVSPLLSKVILILAFDEGSLPFGPSLRNSDPVCGSM